MVYFNELLMPLVLMAVLFIAYAGFSYLFPMKSKQIKKRINLFRMSIIFVFSGFLFGLISTTTMDAESKISTLFTAFLIFYFMFLFANGKRTPENVHTENDYI